MQNQIEGRKWRFTYVNLEKSVDGGAMEVIKQVDINNRADELEGFTFINSNKSIAVTSARKNNVNYTSTAW